MKFIKFFILLIIAFVIIASAPIKIPTPYQFPKLRFFPEMPLPEKNLVTEEGVELGRYLFYDPILSKDSSFSCGTCHKQENAFSDGGKRFSKGIDGRLLERNTMPLFNLAWYPSLFWDGRAKSIEEQVFHPVRAKKEMNLDWKTASKRIRNSKFYVAKFRAAFDNLEIDSILITRAIAQFERTLISHNSRYDQALRREILLTEEEYTGFVLMNDQSMGDCLHCHTTDSDALGTTTKFSNNGLDAITNPNDFKDLGKGKITGKIDDYGKFKIPSLRNIAVTSPYMHDGRFNTLEEVLDFYSEGVNPNVNIDAKMGLAHQGGVKLTSLEKKQIIAFLHTLTDSSFLKKSEFSNPFLVNKKK